MEHHLQGLKEFSHTKHREVWINHSFPLFALLALDMHFKLFIVGQVLQCSFINLQNLREGLDHGVNGGIPMETKPVYKLLTADPIAFKPQSG